MQAALTSTFPERLRNILDETGIRQTDLCDKAGIGKSAMSQYLHGAFIPKQAKLSAIAEALGVSEGWLLGYDVPRMRSTWSGPDGRINEEYTDQYIEMFAPDNSMQSTHIPKGARVVLRKWKETISENCELPIGEIVCIVEKDGKTQLRFLHRDGEQIMLTAAGTDVVPKLFNITDLQDGTLKILGTVEKVEIRF